MHASSHFVHILLIAIYNYRVIASWKREDSNLKFCLTLCFGSKRSSSSTSKLSKGKELLFTEEGLKPLRDIEGFKVHGEDFIEVSCHCTHRTHGDTGGKLTLSSDGRMMITCDCDREHETIDESTNPKQMTPIKFVKHAQDSRNVWTKNIWVIIKDKKVPLDASGLLDYYNEKSNRDNLADHRQFHRDEFIRCSECNIPRRFLLRTEDEFRRFHDASANETWRCSDHYAKELACGKDKERTSRLSYRGCLSGPECKGCPSCVCLGCKICRFKDCDCRACVKFWEN